MQARVAEPDARSAARLLTVQKFAVLTGGEIEEKCLSQSLLLTPFAVLQNPSLGSREELGRGGPSCLRDWYLHAKKKVLDIGK